MKGFGKAHQVTTLLFSLVYMVSVFSGGCESKPKRDKKANSKATATAASPNSVTRSGGQNKVDEGEDEVEGGETPENDSGNTEEPAPKDPEPEEDEENSPQKDENPDKNKPKESPPPPQDKESDGNGGKLPQLPQKPEKNSSEITFSPSLLGKLCRMDHDGAKGDLDDVVERLMENSHASAESLGNRREYGYLTSDEIELIRPLIIRIHPRRYDHIDNVICDDFKGEGRIYNFEQLVYRIND
jgi:hypothetical protein